MNQGFSKRKRSALSKKEMNPTSDLIIKGLISFALTLLVAIVLLLIFAFAASLLSDPDKLLTPLALIALYITAFAGGMISSARSEYPFMASLINGAALLLVCVIMSFFNYSAAPSAYSVWISLICHLAVVPVSLLGAFIMIKSKDNQRRHSQKRFRR